MNERILIVDEDKNIRDLLASALKASGYGVLEAQSFAQARMLALSHCPDLMLLELNLPDGDGLDLIRFLRAQMDLPMVVVSVRAHQRDKVEALDGGADDYITKPFSVRELIARVKALLRRAAPQNDDEGILHVGSLTIDVGNYEAFRNGEKLSLTLKEFELLKLLVISRGKVLTRDFLLDRIWGYEFYGETRTVDVHIRHIRQKLGDDAHYIETIRGVGYKFNDRQENRL